MASREKQKALKSADGLKSRGRTARLKTGLRGTSLENGDDPKYWEWQSVLNSVNQSAENKDGEIIIPPVSADRFISRAVLPTLSISERAELSQLSEALSYFITCLEQTRVQTAIMQDRSQIEQLMSIAKQENSLYELFFREVIRQVGEQCKERGRFLGQLRDQYSQMFNRVIFHTSGLERELAQHDKLAQALQKDLAQVQKELFDAHVESEVDT
jgi:hypothetical protein